MRATILVTLIFFLICELSANSGPRIWVYLKDKGKIESNNLGRMAQSYPGELAMQRRLKKGLSPLVEYTDLPLEYSYLQRLREAGFIIHRQSRWLNAVSGWMNEDNLLTLDSLPFVLKVEIVRSHRFKNPYAPADLARPHIQQVLQNEYGLSENQNKMIGIPQAHHLGYHGEGIRIALFDTGFLLQHESLEHVQVIGSRDFIQGDINVANEEGDDPSQHNHGTEVLAVMAGYKSGQIIGPAYAAEFLLAKTEKVKSETHVEEDNWVAAAEWADSMGADIISTSLGYSTFDSGQVDYTYADMDGNTTLITRAADLAAGKGIAVFAAAGNEGDDPWYYITAPADGDSVIAIGGVRADGSPWSASSNGPTADGRTKPDLVAQGVGVYSVSPNTSQGYAFISGTSMACPLAAGAAAILLSIDPTLTPMELRAMMVSTATQALNPDNKTGYGIIDLEKSILQLSGKVVLLTSFVVNSSAGRNVLDWTVNSSMKISRWIIERQAGQAEFDMLDYLEVPAEQNYPARFTFVDLDISGGELFRYRLYCELDSAFSLILDTLTVQSLIPQSVTLEQSFPNPFNDRTQIIFGLPRQQKVNLKIYDGTGRLVRILIHGAVMPSAFHHVVWEGRTDHGVPAASGVYYIALSTESAQKVIKALFIK